jgi:predicted secreted hydrolase
MARRPRKAAVPVLALVVLICAAPVAGCSSSGRVLANEPVATPMAPSPLPEPTRVADPLPVTFPNDEAPHGRMTEWWYYTGHLAGRSYVPGVEPDRFGFEFVIFRAERGIFPATWASHLALTDDLGNRFTYDQRFEVGRQVDRSEAGGGFDLAVRGGGVTPDGSVAAPGKSTWRMAGRDGLDQLSAASEEAGFGLDLTLDAGDRPPVLHDTGGWVDFGPAGGSYYYSRTRLDATGTLTLADGSPLPVTGIGWFDHQWGDFIAVGAGGWDWFAIQLADGTDIMLSLIRDRDGDYPLVYGELVAPDGSYRHLERDAFSVEATGSWTSERTGVEYPAGWVVTIPAERLRIELTPSVSDQELDTRDTTGVIYWEGSQVVRATRNGQLFGGEAYVELTGYTAGR